MINEQSFYDIVDIKEEEKESARAFLNNRGITEHIRMAEYLSAFINRKPTYSEVATAFRYDKRIRRIIYKYLGLLEERIRAYIANRYETVGDIPNYRNSLIRNQKDLKYSPLDTNAYDFVSNLYFSNLINVINNLDCKDKMKVFGKNVLKNNLNAVVELRNVISHNRTLLNYLNYRSVSLSNGVVSSSLLTNIPNLYYLLPTEIKDSFKDEINDASSNKLNKLNIQVGWVALKFYLLNI